MNNQPVCEIDKCGNRFWQINDLKHREDGPAVEWANGSKWWYLEDERVEPEDVVDVNLAKGVFCYYDEEANELIFGGNND